MVGAVISATLRMFQVVAAIFDLSRPAHYVHLGWFEISYGNLAVIVFMIALFVLALFLPFPKARRPK
jgi:hypothetical protein